METDCKSAFAAKGYFILGWGWLGPLGGILAWYANPLMIWQIYRLLQRKSVLLLPAVLIFGLALSGFLWKHTPMDNGETTVCQRHIGFYLWVACALTLALASIIDAFYSGFGEG